MRVLAAAAMAIVLTLGACATEQAKGPYAKSGFYTHVHDNRLWVLKAGDKDIETVAKNQEPRVVVTHIGAGPNGMTMRSNDSKVIDEYLAAR